MLLTRTHALNSKHGMMEGVRYMSLQSDIVEENRRIEEYNRRLEAYNRSINLFRSVRGDNGVDAQVAALREIYRYVLMLYFRIGQNNNNNNNEYQHLVEDCAQETIIIVMYKLESVRREGLFLAWVKQIAIRVYFDQIKKDKRENIASVSLDDLRPGEEWVLNEERIQIDAKKFDMEEDVTALIRRYEVRALMLEAIDTMKSKQQQQTIICLFILNMSMNETAEKLGVTSNYLRGLKMRGLRKMKDILSTPEFQEKLKKLV